MSVTTWNIAPDYDQWGVDSSWSCDDWIQWHKQLLNKFGAVRAKSIWDYAFAQSGNLSQNLDCRTFNGTFKDYVSKHNLNPMANAGVFAPILNTYNAANEIGANLLDSLTSLTKGNTLKTILNVAIVVTVAGGGFYVYKTFKK